MEHHLGGCEESAAGRISDDSPQDFRMDWSLGQVADPLWRLFPQLRGPIRKMVDEELNDAIAADRPLEELSPYELCSHFYHRIMQPALVCYPVSADTLRNCSRFIRYMLQLGIGESLYLDALLARVVESMSMTTDGPVLSQIDDGLVAYIAEHHPTSFKS